MNKNIAEELTTECVDLWMHNIKHGKSVDVRHKMSMIVFHILSQVENENSEAVKSSIKMVDHFNAITKYYDNDDYGYYMPIKPVFEFLTKIRSTLLGENNETNS